MIQSKLTPFFWAEAVATSCYLKNRCPSKSLNNQIRYYLWINKKPILSHLKPDGCKACMLNKDPIKGKFNERATECIF